MRKTRIRFTLNRGLIGEIMKDQGITQTKLARTLYTNQTQINRLLTGKIKNPSVSTVAELADALSVGVNVILKDSRPLKRRK